MDSFSSNASFSTLSNTILKIVLHPNYNAAKNADNQSSRVVPIKLILNASYRIILQDFLKGILNPKFGRKMKSDNF